MNSKVSFIIIVIISFLFSCKTEVKEELIKKEIEYKPVFNEVSNSEKKKIQKESLRFFNENLNTSSFSGQFLIAKNGKVLYLKSQGWSNFKDKIEMTATTPMHVASVSKVITAITVLKLVQENKLSLDDDIRKFLPEILYNGIKVRQLLNHRSGIPYYGYFTFHTWKLGVTLKNKDILKLLNKYKFPLNFKPDTHFSYCNTNFALLAIIVERITKQKYAEAVNEIVLKPLKMNNSFVMTTKREYKVNCQSYKSNFEVQQYDYLDAVYGDKNFYTTALDLLRLDNALYGIKFLNDSLKKEMFKGYSYENPGISNYGLGIRMKEEKGKNPYFFHTGWWHGNTACYSRLMNDTICIISISNKYTRSLFSVGKLVDKFGNYPFDWEEEGN